MSSSTYELPDAPIPLAMTSVTFAVGLNTLISRIFCSVVIVVALLGIPFNVADPAATPVMVPSLLLTLKTLVLEEENVKSERL